MTPDDGVPVVYRLDGRKIRSPSDFYREIGAAVNGTGGYFGRNLDALADCLRGGFGTPDDRAYRFDWQHSALSRSYLAGVRRGQRSFVEAVQEVFDDAGITLRLC